MQPKKITPEMVKKAKWRAEFFMDLADGGYSQRWICTTYPRLTHAKWADTKAGPHRQGFWVDGEEVKGSAAIADALNANESKGDAAASEPK